MSKFLRWTGKKYVLLYCNVTIPEISKWQMVTFNNLVKFPCPTNSLQFTPCIFPDEDFLCKRKLFQVHYFWTLLLWDFCLWYVDEFPVDYWLWWRVDCYCINHQYRMCCTFLFWIKTEERNFCLLSVEAFEVAQLRTFLLVCCTLSLVVYCPVF